MTMLVGIREATLRASWSRGAARVRDGAQAVNFAALWYWSIFAISVVFVIGTFIATSRITDSFVVQLLTLKSENSPGALWSGLLLALVAIHAYDGYALWRRRQIEVAKAWISIALVMLIFSADEIGSIHERVSMFGQHLGIGSWLPLLPFAIVVMAMIGYALVLLWRVEEQRRTALVLLLGFSLLATVPLQEFIEHRIVLTSDTARAFRFTLEEGTEIAGMLVLLKAALANTAFAQRRGVETWPCLEAVRELWVPVTVTSLLLAPFLAVGTTMFEDNRGRLADWLAAVLLLGAALAACRPYLRGEDSRLAAWILAGIYGVAALAIAGMGPDRVIWLGPVEASMRLLTLAVLSPVAIAVWGLLHGRRSIWLNLIAVALMADLIALALLPVGPVGIYLVTQLLAIAIYVAQASGEGAWQSAAASQMSPPRTSRAPGH